MLRFFVLLPFLWTTACATYKVTEDQVFTPVTAYQETDDIDLSLEREDVFASSGPFKIEIEAWEKQRASINVEAGAFEPAQLKHGFIKGNGPEIAYTLITRGNPGRPLIVHCGGSTAARQDSGTLYGLKLIEFGDALLFDYPGYGDSPGKTTVAGLKAMNSTVADFVKALTGSGRPLILWGHSLGGFVCADMASEFESVDGIVLETSARNAAEVADVASPWFAKPFIRIIISDEVAKFDNVDALKGIDAPILVLGARKDRTLPVRLSRALASALQMVGHDVTYIEFPEANHISVATIKDFPNIIENFLSRATVSASV